MESLKIHCGVPRKTKDPNANWFSMSEDDMMAAIGKRNAAKKTHEQAPTAANRAELRRKKQSVKDLTARCKGAWVQHHALGIQNISRGTSHAWECCTRASAPAWMGNSLHE